ncbi:hypothetical protein SO802_030458 [Lithocarpus litseifolius]|uniref:Uncharacterized protein n=1 Tax=Lithocarpus litseifolius TaxID=425828 RepID=A0AAW2BK31_9ROSI
MVPTCFVVSANGFQREERLNGIFTKKDSELQFLFLHGVYLGGWNESNPSEQNHVTITVEFKNLNWISSSSSITWLGVHVDCICCKSSSVPDCIDHHSFPSDVGLQMDTTNGLDLPMGHPGLGFTYGLDDLGSSSIARICDNIELPPSPAIFSTPCGSDLDHGVFNTGGVVLDDIVSTVHSNGYDLGFTSIANPFLSIGYNDSDVGEHWPPSVPKDTIRHSLPSDMLPVDTTNGSELGLGRLNLGFSDGFDLGSSSVAHAFDNNDSDLGLDWTVYNNGYDLDLTSIANPFLSIGYNNSNVGEHWPPLVSEDIIHHSFPSNVLLVDTTSGSELVFGRQDLGFSDGFDQGSSSMAHAFDNNNSDFNQFPPSKKARTS